jgi:NAD(P)H dehydrogenase (quinone)
MNDSSNLLVLGATGQVGKLVANNLKRSGANFSVGSRRKANLEDLANRFGASRFIDLDDPRTFDEALKNITGIFLITGYTVDMLVQSKSFIDAAKRNGVNHIVHLGAFTRDHDASATVFAWHQMIEAYLRDSGVAWTNLHPNMFMQSFLSVWSIKGGLYSAYTSKAIGFTAVEDVAEAAAVILMEGPEKHTGKDYWFSADVLTPHQVAETLSAATGRKFTAAVRKAEGFQNDAVQPGSAFEPAYAKGGFELFRQVEDGRMAYIGSVADDTKRLLGREPLLLRDWAKLHANELLEAVGRESGAPKAGIASTLASFVKANNDRDTDSVVACFSTGAVVHDDGQVMRGTDEIRQWIAELFRKFQYVVAPTNVRELENGAILTATITGNFPGARVSLDYHCRTLGDTIDVMIIQPSRLTK